ncbi:DUF1704 domain-containing protein [Pasteurella atlantica]|uniref:tyrosine/phenylalanine carboxypeptidase domain-containing protein n=1 Tax=Pasteurellaceae TaxID=712 RepID=UPI00276E5307|nr:tyrosine/phenylalanine carboxypeptidase domain-containing protein [Pasteurella atlantica]MDP8033789.1 DUF1704 domain-containing protein [Pasteurella atlantica]MDP8035724.1 DUF1704 domain-containing protein [Pasteurella atlantica]MDP8037740.1 DUF1704 domain-containing protein [Pasteurella atlantica]MDP8048024.1 DUF1704 domain-containing protein [Pasteurella atlantica]MDP8050048.1 DUF1704 domain-containing protein [Pasteurella atlantica]
MEGVKTIKIFLASSNELKKDRENFEIFIGRKNKIYNNQGIFLELRIWEDFNDSISSTRKQNDYNEAIKDSDILLCLFHTKVGRFTEEEFDEAFSEFKRKGKPAIYTYFKTEAVNLNSLNREDMNSLWDFQEKLASLGHFYTLYTNTDYLLNQFSNQLEKYITTHLICPAKSTSSLIKNRYLNLVPQYNCHSLLGRKEKLDEIDTVLMGSKKLVILSGIEGIGKTTISLAYCNTSNFMEKYHHIAWVTVNDNLQSDLMHQLSNKKTGFEYSADLDLEKNFYNLKTSLSMLEGKNLLIIDNVNDSRQLMNIKSMLESLRWNILITSKAEFDECEIIHLDTLNFQDCKKLFLEYYKKKDSSDEVLKLIFKEINYHTLFIILLAKALNKHPLSNMKGIKNNQDARYFLTEQLLKNKISISNPSLISAENNLLGHLMALFDLESLSPNEQKYLVYFSVLPYSDISINDLLKIFQIKEENLVDFINILNDLVIKGLLTQNNLENEIDMVIAYKCHPLIQEVVREKLDISAKNLNDLLQFFINKIEIRPDTNWIESKPYMTYIDEIIINIKEYNFNYAKLLREYARLLEKFSLFEKAIKCAEDSLALMEVDKSCDQLEIAKTYMVVGNCYSRNGYFNQGLEKQLKTKDLIDKLENHPNIELGRLYILLMINYRDLAEYDMSVKYARKAISILKQDKEMESQLELARAYDLLGFTYSKWGLKLNDNNKYRLALFYRLLGFRIRRKYLAEEHPYYGGSLNNIGKMYLQLNKLNKASKYHKKSLDNKVKNYGEYHPSTAFAYNNLSRIYLQKKDFDIAMKYCDQASQCIEGKLHEHHPRIAINKTIRAKIYFCKNELDKALEYVVKALLIQKKIQKNTKNADYQEAFILWQKIKFAILEREYWDFKRTINLIKDITPLNLNQEKEQFIAKFRQNQKYNPIFKYCNSRDNSEVIEKLQIFYKQFSDINFCLSELYKISINKDIEWLTHFENKGVTFNNWLSSLYGKPKDEDIQQALDILKTYNCTLNKNEEQISAVEAQRFITSKLEMCGYNWKVTIQNMSAKMSVSSLEQTLNIKDSATFTLSEIERLYVHEIETHILRNENGKKQKYEIFSIGFPNYLATEEGLATLAEERNHLRSKYDEMKYALRLILCDKCLTTDFWDLFIFVKQYITNDSDAFDMVARIKRGLENTALFGGYTKDQVYFSGYNQLKLLPNEILKKLYIGKVGIEDLDLLLKLDSNDLDYNIKIPDWLDE